VHYSKLITVNCVTSFLFVEFSQLSESKNVQLGSKIFLTYNSKARDGRRFLNNAPEAVKTQQVWHVFLVLKSGVKMIFTIVFFGTDFRRKIIVKFFNLIFWYWNQALFFVF